MTSDDFCKHLVSKFVSIGGAVTKYSNGSVSKRGGKWYGQIRRKKDGEKRWGTLTKTFDIPSDPKTNKGRPAAERALAEWRAALLAADAANAAAPGRNTPIAEYVERFITAKANSGTVERSTISGYRNDAKHIARWLGGERMGDLNAKRVERMMADMLAAGVPANTVKKTCNSLSRVCNYAVTVGDIPANPCTGVKRPKATHKKANALDAASVEKLNAALDAMGHTVFADAVRLLLLTGMRRGELCGLRWCDVDMKAQTIKVRNAIGHDNGRPYVKPPKNDGSERTIPYGATVAQILKGRFTEQAQDCLALGVPAGGELYVLGPATSQELAETAFYSPAYLTKQFRMLANMLDLKGTQGTRPVLHDLRHTFATHALASGMDVESVSALLGHKNASMTLDIYADALPDNKREVMEHMGEILSKAAEPGSVVGFTGRKAANDA